MRVWVVKIGEPLPTDGDGIRLGRAGLLAAALARAGHDVTWWTSRFAHALKRYRNELSDVVPVAGNYRIRLLRTSSYRRNIGAGRILSEWLVAYRFEKAIQGLEPPDLIVTSLPTPKLCRICVEFGLVNRVPVVVDVRDLWPEVQVGLAPEPLRPFARMMFAHEFANVRQACRHATALSGITDDFVAWGLRYAGRAWSASDFAFPLAPPPPVFREDQRRAARLYWERLGLTPTREILTICYVGVLGRRSVAEMNCLVDAVKAAGSTGESIRLVIAGDGDMRDEFLKRAAGAPNIIVPGWIESAQITELMQRSHIGIIPYENSPDFQSAIPNKALEYLANGLPVMTSVRGVLARLIENTGCGLVYDGKRESNLRHLLTELASWRERLETMSHNAARLFESRFTPGKVYGEAVRRLESIARQNSRAAYETKTCSGNQASH